MNKLSVEERVRMVGCLLVEQRIFKEGCEPQGGSCPSLYVLKFRPRSPDLARHRPRKQGLPIMFGSIEEIGKLLN